MWACEFPFRDAIMKSSIRGSIALLVTALALGCVTTAKQGGSGGSGASLTQQQLSTANAANLYEAIVRLRPNWLTSRGPTSVSNSTPTSVDVFVGNTFLGKADYLQQLRLGDVTEVKYWDPGSAAARFGMGHPRGVIEITMK
jgi:hypothetical protein